jgi:hypothetical protein
VSVVRAAGAAVLLGILLAAASAAPASAEPRICFYALERNVASGSKTGHAFVQLLPDAGPQAGTRTLVYGFYPKVQARFLDGPGEVRDDAKTGWHFKQCENVSREKYDTAVTLVNRDIKNPPDYVFLKFNCTDWIFKVANRIGVSLPSARAFITNVFDPEALAKNLEGLWHRDQGGRNVFNGRYYKNTGNTSAESSVDPPIDWEDPGSYTDLAQLARAAPRTLARGLDMTAHTPTLPRISVGVGRRLRVSLTRINALRAITEVQFGDGTRAFQKLLFTHRYTHAGRYRLRGIAIAGATVERYSFTVTVDRRHGDGRMTLAVPNQRPGPDTGPRLPAPIPPLPE